MTVRVLLARSIAVIVAGAALAAPAMFVELRGPDRSISLPLLDGRFSYSYRQSIYEVPVREELRVAGDRIRIERALSTDRRALEYFRWPGDATEEDGMLAWAAPDVASAKLELLVTPDGEQTIEAPARRVVLRDAFGAHAAVTVRPARGPLLLWLWRVLPWA